MAYTVEKKDCGRLAARLIAVVLLLAGCSSTPPGGVESPDASSRPADVNGHSSTPQQTGHIASSRPQTGTLVDVVDDRPDLEPELVERDVVDVAADFELDQPEQDIDPVPEDSDERADESPEVTADLEVEADDAVSDATDEPVLVDSFDIDVDEFRLEDEEAVPGDSGPDDMELDEGGSDASPDADPPSDPDPIDYWTNQPLATTSASAVDTFTTNGGNLGLAHNNLVWSDWTVNGTDSVGNIYVSRLGGDEHLIWSGSGYWSTRMSSMFAGERLLGWMVPDGAGEDLFYLYDLGVDGLPESGDEAFPTNPFPIFGSPGHANLKPSADIDEGDVAFSLTQGARIEVLSFEMSPTPPQLVTTSHVELCDGCLEQPAGSNQVVGLSVGDGCVIWSDEERQVRVHCRENSLWGDWDDSEFVVSNESGACSNEFNKYSFASVNRYVIEDRGGHRIAAWIENQLEYPWLARLCLWVQGEGPAQPIYEVEHRDLISVVADEYSLYFTESYWRSRSRANRTVLSYALESTDPFSSSVKEVPILPGQLGRLAADNGRIAVARSRDGDDAIELYESNERPLTQNRHDHVDPDVDGDRVVWIDYRHHYCGEVYTYDRATERTRRLTNSACGSSTRTYNGCPQVSGDRVVWSQTSSRYAEPRRCAGHIHGIDLNSEERIWITQNFDDVRNLGPARISGDLVLFSLGAFWSGPTAYHYEWGGELPQVEASFVTMAGSPDVSGDRIVYVSGLEEGSFVASEVRSCRISDACANPLVIAPPIPMPGRPDHWWFAYRVEPRIRDEQVVWFDSRETSYAEYEADHWEHHLYHYDFSSPVRGGTQLSTTAWASGIDEIPDLLWGFSDLSVSLWDTLEPSIGYDPARATYFVVTTSFEKSRQHGYFPWPGERETVRIDFGGPYAGQEQNLTFYQGWQHVPAADGEGHIVWQDRRDGIFFQLVEYKTPE